MLDHSSLLRLILNGLLVLVQIRGRLHPDRLLLVLLRLAGIEQLLLVHLRGLILVVCLLMMVVGRLLLLLRLLELYHDRSAVRRDGQGLLAGQQRQRRVVAQGRQRRHIEQVVRRLLGRRGALQAVRNHGRQGWGVLDERLLLLRLQRLLLLLSRDDLVPDVRRVQLVLELIADERLVGLLEAGRVLGPERGWIQVGPLLVVRVRRVHALAGHRGRARRRSVVLVVKRGLVLLLRLYGRLYDL